MHMYANFLKEILSNNKKFDANDIVSLTKECITVS